MGRSPHSDKYKEIIDYILKDFKCITENASRRKKKLKCQKKKDTSKPDWAELMPQDWAMKF